MSLKISHYHYHLPSRLVAHQPSPVRDRCRLLSLNKSTGQIDHRHFFDLAKILTKNDVLVLNQSKVFPARLFGQKTTGGQFEILLLHPTTDSTWLAISKPRLLPSQQLEFNHNLKGTVITSNKSTGQVEIKFNFSEFLTKSATPLSRLILILLIPKFVSAVNIKPFLPPKPALLPPPPPAFILPKNFYVLSKKEESKSNILPSMSAWALSKISAPKI
jgi:hypothetical protein